MHIHCLTIKGRVKIIILKFLRHSSNVQFFLNCTFLNSSIAHILPNCPLIRPHSNIQLSWSIRCSTSSSLPISPGHQSSNFWVVPNFPRLINFQRKSDIFSQSWHLSNVQVLIMQTFSKTSEAFYIRWLRTFLFWFFSNPKGIWSWSHGCQMDADPSWNPCWPKIKGSTESLSSSFGIVVGDEPIFQDATLLCTKVMECIPSLRIHGTLSTNYCTQGISQGTWYICNTFEFFSCSKRGLSLKSLRDLESRDLIFKNPVLKG